MFYCRQGQESFDQLYNMTSRIKKDKSGEIPLFIVKLQQIVNNPQLEDVVGWTSSSDSFVIRNVSRFTEEVLPAYYKHHNFASFIRQLNIYSFKKVRHSDGENVYAHLSFIKGRPNLIKNIVRKSREEKDESAPVLRQSSMDDRKGRQISELKSRQQDLYDMCRQFLLHNKKMMEENEQLVHMLERDCSEKEKRLEQFLIYLATQKNCIALTESNALSIHQPDHQDEQTKTTPLQVLANNMDHDEAFNKMKSILQSAYNNGRANRRRDNNFTIVPQRVETPTKEPVIHFDRTEQLEQSPFLPPQDLNSFLSLDDFDFADQRIDLQSSR